MAKEIVWTKKAFESFSNVIDYLNTEWSLSETASFVNATDRVIEQIAKYPRMFRKTSKTDVHEALVTPHNLLIYSVKESKIELIIFWDTRKNPKRKKY